jgi:hypothetical protein
VALFSDLWRLLSLFIVEEHDLEQRIQHKSSFVIGGADTSSINLYTACLRIRILECEWYVIILIIFLKED